MAFVGRNCILTFILIGIALVLIFQLSSFQHTTAFRKKRGRTRGEGSVSVNHATKENYASLNEFQGFVRRKGDKLFDEKAVKSPRESKEVLLEESGFREHGKLKAKGELRDRATTQELEGQRHKSTNSLMKTTELNQVRNTKATPTKTSNVIMESTKAANLVVENSHIKRGIAGGNNYCKLSFDYGEMCPPSYVELGGKCDLTPEGFDCPDIRNKSSFSHRQGQLVTTRMLKIFDLVAQKHNIAYWLTSGTLLGAARHRGNIPWDTDNDIDMPLKDYIKLFKIAKKELPDDFFLQNSVSDPFLRPSNEKEALSMAHPKVGIYRRSWNPRFRDKKSCYKYCISHGCKWHDGLMIDIFVLDGDVSAAFPLKRMDFEGFSFNVPNNWKQQLSNSYGKDYYKVPAEKSKRNPVDFPDTFHSCDELRGKQ